MSSQRLAAVSLDSLLHTDGCDLLKIEKIGTWNEPGPISVGCYGEQVASLMYAIVDARLATIGSRSVHAAQTRVHTLLARDGRLPFERDGYDFAADMHSEASWTSDNEYKVQAYCEK
uniref:Uncharacterized protein n=1 Tax=Romanomermis culicivorax TaxID=13658 RepID=A0A915JZ51_ROMCU